MRVSGLVAALGAVLAAVAVYTGWQAEPFWRVSLVQPDRRLHLQRHAGLLQSADVFAATCEPAAHVLSSAVHEFLALSALFVLIFWVILMLWAALFRVIEIDFFHELFTEDWFIFPVLGFAFGLGVIIFWNLTRVIDNITKLLHGLIKLLLPLVVAVAIIFLAALPFAGLDVLWSTGNGTALLLWLLAIILFFTNAGYQDGRETTPYSPLFHRLIYLGLCVMPVISGLSLYGLVLRLNQYGWTVERCWALVVWLTLSLFAVGYVAGIVRRRAEWTIDLGRVNTAMGLVVLALMLFANSPALDFRKLSLESQLNRLASGDIELGDFDFWYAKNHLARPGYLAMEDMKQQVGDTDPELLGLIENPVRMTAGRAARSSQEMWPAMLYRPEAFDVPEELKNLINGSFIVRNPGEPVLIRVDLTDDGQSEYVLFLLHQRGVAHSSFYHLTDEGWQAGSFAHAGATYDADVREQIMTGAIEVVDLRFQNLDIGGMLSRPYPSE